MKLSDITVEARDINLKRLGVIRPEDLHLEADVLASNVGTWKLVLSTEHPLAGPLRLPGAGIVVTGPDDVLFSGPTTKPESASTPDSPLGNITIEGVTDEVLLTDRLAYPSPGRVAWSQLAAHDERTGPAETLMHAYVNANLGSGAHVDRQQANFTMGADGGRGPTLTKKPRFRPLGELIAELGTLGDLGFRIVQRGDVLRFETYALRDKKAEIRLDVRNRTLAGQRVATAPPGVTRVIVAGQGEQEDRTFTERTNAPAMAGEVDWGRRIERFVDQRQTDDIKELNQAGDELLAEEGFSSVIVQAVPTEDSSMRFGKEWRLGDLVTVVVEDQELTAPVAGMALRATSAGFKVGAILGDAAGFSLEKAWSKRVKKAEKRVAALETTSAGGSLYWRGTFSPTGGA